MTIAPRRARTIKFFLQMYVCTYNNDETREIQKQKFLVNVSEQKLIVMVYMYVDQGD
jgi:hypothetical protein